MQQISKQHSQIVDIQSTLTIQDARLELHWFANSAIANADLVLEI